MSGTKPPNKRKQTMPVPIAVDEVVVNDTPEYTTAKFTGSIPLEVIDVASLGKGLTVTANRKVPFTQELAHKLLQLKDCPWERPLKNNHVSFLISEMKKGTFLHELATLATCFCEEDGHEYRINGQHTCWARIEIDQKEYEAKPITVLKYNAVTHDDMRRLYASFDRGASRTRSNVIEAYLGGSDQFMEFTPSLVKLAAAGLSVWLWESGHVRRLHTADDQAYLMQKDHGELVNRVLGFCKQEPALWSMMFLRRAPVVAAMYETFSKAHKASEEFWHAVKVGIGFTSQDDPRLRLRNSLMTTGLVGSGEGSVKKKRVDQETVYRWCITAWNAWRANEGIKVLRTPNKRQRAK